MKSFITVIIVSTVCVFGYANTTLSDEEIKQQIIQESVSSYPGHCPCPYNITSNGSSCGKRSAYSKPGGASPICYPADVTPQMIESYKRRN